MNSTLLAAGTTSSTTDGDQGGHHDHRGGHVRAGAPHAVASPNWFVRLQSGALVASVVLVGLAAGFFFTYQVSIVPALAEVDDETYVATFQSINDTIRNAPFGIVFFGSIPVLCAAVALHARGDRRTRAGVIVALVLYAAVFAITAVGNVPLNEQLGDVVDPDRAAAAAARADFESSWNQLNLIRAVLSGSALLALAVGVVARRR